MWALDAQRSRHGSASSKIKLFTHKNHLLSKTQEEHLKQKEKYFFTKQ